MPMPNNATFIIMVILMMIVDKLREKYTLSTLKSRLTLSCSRVQNLFQEWSCATLPNSPMHMRVCAHVCTQTHFPSLWFSLSLFPVLFPTLNLPLSFFIISFLMLYLSGSLSISALLFSPLLSFSLSSSLPSSSWCLLSLFQHFPLQSFLCPPRHWCAH